MPDRPNILWICTDQQRYDTIGALGNPWIRTPNIDRLCREGVAFSHTYCQSAICSPSRASFLTGLYPSATGVNRNGLPEMPRLPRVRLITHRLAERGYACGLVGKLHLASAWRGQEQRTDDGYAFWQYSHSPYQGSVETNCYLAWLQSRGVDPRDVFVQAPDGRYLSYLPDVDPKLHQTTWCADQAIDYVKSRSASPWLLSVNFFDPHPPFDAPDSCASRCQQRGLPPPLFEPSDLLQQERLVGAYFQGKPCEPGAREQQQKASYYGMIELVDEQVGRILDALEATGQRERTIVIFMSDHGEMLGDHGLTQKGCRFYEGLVRVPLIISWPGHFQRGVVSDALVELTDLAPTLAEVAGVDLEWTHGRSLIPLLTGKASSAEHRQFVRAEYFDALNMHAPEAPELHHPCWATMYRDARHKLVVYHNLGEGELYDLSRDPGEFRNLWHDPASAELRNELIARSFAAMICSVDLGPPLIGRY